MTPERFAVLAEAWGSRIERWPDAERAGAGQLLRRSPGLQALLDHEAALERMLDAHVVPAPSPAWVAEVRAGAPRPAGRRVRRRWIDWLPMAGWSGAGIAGLGLAGAATGALAGVLLVSAALDASAPGHPAAAAEAGWTHTAFDTGPGSMEGVDE